MENIRTLLTLQSVLGLYFFHVTFYSAKYPLWDKVGFWIHSTVAILIFMVMPVVLVTLVGKNFDKFISSGYSGPLVAAALLNIAILVAGLALITKAILDTYQWYKVRRAQPIVEDEQTPYLKIIQAEGAGEI